MISSHNKLNSSKLTSLSDLKPSNIGSKVPQCSSLADLISNHKKLNLPKKELPQNTNSLPFNSLSNLTSHHLRKSVSSATPLQEGDINAKCFSLNKQKENEFVPKIVGLDLKNTVSDSSVNTIVKDVASLNFEKNDKTLKKSSVEAEDEWEVDLSSALKTVVLAKSKNSKVEPPETTSFKNHSTSKSTLNLTNLDIMCDFNLYSLRNEELQYALKKASPMGKVLCRKWKTKKLLSKKKAWYFETSPNVKRFDFIDPSPDSKILQYLRKRV